MESREKTSIANAFGLGRLFVVLVLAFMYAWRSVR
jgi:hypothetical protein